MADIKRFDKSKRTHWRSDDVVTQIRRSVPWYRRYKWGMAFVGFLAAGTLTQIVIWKSGSQSVSTQNLPAMCVASVTDGDTFRFCNGDKVRLVAASGPIDAPETSYREGRWNDPALGEKAKQRLAQLIKGGVLDCDGLDRYDRSLCRVTVAGQDVGDQLVAEELAVIRDEWR